VSAPRVVVVGGGLAGLTAALACADGGAAVTLLERRPRLGGATWSFEHKGLWFDNGQHVFLRCCASYRELLERIGATDRVVLQDRLAIPVIRPGGRTAWIRRGDGRPPLHLARSLLAYRHLRPVDRVRIGRAALALRRLDPDDPSTDARSFAEWLAAQGQSRAAIDAVWDLIGLPTLNLPASEASLAQAAMVFRTALLSAAGAADVGWARVPLVRVHAEPAARALAEAGASVLTRVAVDRIVTSSPDGAVAGIEADGHRFDADAVVVAVPHEAAAGLLPPGAVPHPGRLVELGTSPIVNVHVVLDRPVTNLPFAAGLDSPVQWVFDRTDSSGLPEGQCLAVSLSAADAYLGLPSRELADRIVAALRDLFPAARDARVVDTVVTREHAATFRAAPGHRSLRPAAHTGVVGLLLAGAWTDTGWPATMEGAVRSGLTAARAALVAAGRSRALPAEVQG
jgi:squalene-associated FAD-dependent desaturase